MIANWACYLCKRTECCDVRAHCVVMCSIEGDKKIEQQSVRCERPELKTRSRYLVFTKRIPCCIDAAVDQMLHMSYLAVAIGTSASEGSVVSEGSAASQAIVVSKGSVASLCTTEDHFLLRSATLYYDVQPVLQRTFLSCEFQLVLPSFILYY